MRDVVSHVPTPRVAHPFYVKRGAGLAARIYQLRGEIDAFKACLAGDEPCCSRVPEEAPPPINIGIVIGHVI